MHLYFVGPWPASHFGDPAWGRAGRANIGQGTRAVRSWLVAASAAMVTSRRSSESNAVSVEVHFLQLHLLKGTPGRGFSFLYKYRGEMIAIVSHCICNETDCALKEYTCILRLKVCSINNKNKAGQTSTFAFFLSHSFFGKVTSSCVNCILSVSTLKLVLKRIHNLWCMSEVCFCKYQIVSFRCKGSYHFFTFRSFLKWVGHMNPILSSKSKLDIQVHEKTNLSIVWTTQIPGGLIPVGLGFPASGSLIACMCCVPAWKVNTEQVSLLGGRQIQTAPVIRPSSEDRNAEIYINHIANKTLN